MSDDMHGESWYHYPGEAETMRALAECLPENAIIVNIGTGYGTSCLAFAEGNPTATIFTIDIQPREGALLAWEKVGRIIRVLGRSQDVGRVWPVKVNMVFIDGAHGKEAVLEDIQVWRPHVKRRGVLAFHDYDNPICPHVKEAVDEGMGRRRPFVNEGYIRAYRC